MTRNRQIIKRLPVLFSVVALLCLGSAAILLAPGDEPNGDQAAEAIVATPTLTTSTATATPSPVPVTPTLATPTAQPTMPTPQVTTTPEVTPTPFPDVGRAQVARIAPSALIIPRIGVDAAIVSVGVTAEGQLEAPSDYSTVGWYRAGAVPGEVGRAVLDGHLDSRTGPAVFYRLEELAPGDEIIVRSVDGEQVFIVRESALFWTDEAPLDRIFGPSDRAELVLITCDGPFDGGGDGYLQRRVIFAERRSAT